jgi:hypothetical protein
VGERDVRSFLYLVPQRRDESLQEPYEGFKAGSSAKWLHMSHIIYFILTLFHGPDYITTIDDVVPGPPKKHCARGPSRVVRARKARPELNFRDGKPFTANIRPLPRLRLRLSSFMASG